MTEVIEKLAKTIINKALAAIKTDAYFAHAAQVSSEPVRLQKLLRRGGWVR
ncbi:MAG TPA: hypothetical protein VIM63_18765 [Rhodoferax sp.]